MAVFKKRTRIISFRISEEEYETLQHISMLNGAHSVSDYARSVACRFITAQTTGEEPSLTFEIQALNRRIDEMYRHLMRLAQLVESDLTPALSVAKDAS